MTRKDYVLIATAIKAAYNDSQPENLRGVWDAAVYLADVLADDNAAFDRARFLKACGVQS